MRCSMCGCDVGANFTQVGATRLCGSCNGYKEKDDCCICGKEIVFPEEWKRLGILKRHTKCKMSKANEYKLSLSSENVVLNAFEKKDAINPDHYKNNGLETIDVIKAWLTKEEYIGFLKGNMLKYQSRAGKKENNSELQDYKKINWYQNKLIEELQRD